MLTIVDGKLLDVNEAPGACSWVMAMQSEKLDLDRCPHCRVDKPNLHRNFEIATNSHSGHRPRYWALYGCTSCGGLVLTAAQGNARGKVQEQYPAGGDIAEDIPDRARTYLQQAQASLHAPSGAVMLAASAVDAMLKTKGFTEGTLYSRIDGAVAAHLITAEMGAWAHEVRLDANDQRHADEEAPLPTAEDAARTLGFALALAEYLFVLPSRVLRGRRQPQ